jgi:hypothetical protein
MSTVNPKRTLLDLERQSQRLLLDQSDSST